MNKSKIMTEVSHFGKRVTKKKIIVLMLVAPVWTHAFKYIEADRRT